MGSRYALVRMKDKTMARSEHPSLITPTFRVSCPNVFVKQVVHGRGGDSERYTCTALFSGFEVIDGRTNIKAPTTWPEKDQAKWNAIIQECNKVAIQAFTKPMRELDRSVYELPFHRGEEKEGEGYGPGIVYFTMSASNHRPCIITRDGTMIRQYGPEEFYAGCYARASVMPFANRQWKFVSIRLCHLQKVAEGVRLDASSLTGDDFGADSSEYDVRQQKWTGVAQ